VHTPAAVEGVPGRHVARRTPRRERRAAAPVEDVSCDLRVAEMSQQVHRQPYESELVRVSSRAVHAIQQDASTQLRTLAAIQRHALVDLGFPFNTSVPRLSCRAAKDCAAASLDVSPSPERQG
jgi:hypothetical protein